MNGRQEHYGSGSRRPFIMAVHMMDGMHVDMNHDMNEDVVNP